MALINIKLMDTSFEYVMKIKKKEKKEETEH